MAVLRIDIAGNPKTLPFRQLLQVGADSIGILDDLDHAFSHAPRGATEWYINDLGMNGKLRLEIYSQIKRMRRKLLPDVGIRVASSFVTGFRILEKEGASPPYLTDTGMRRAERLTSVLGREGTRAIVASVPEQQAEVEITKRSALNLERLLPEASTSLGSVEGHLEGINLHRNPRFIVYQGGTNKAVTCGFGALELRERIKDSLEHRVSVSGRLWRNARGEPVRIKLFSTDDLKVFGSDLKILPFRDVRACDPEFTAELTTEQFLRSARE